MSNTITDFMNFFSPRKNVAKYTCTEICDNIYNLIKSEMKKSGIEIINRIPSDISAIGYKNELEQVVLNLLQNSKDAFDGRDILDKKIILSLYQEANGFIYIYIDDNAGDDCASLPTGHLVRLSGNAGTG